MQCAPFISHATKLPLSAVYALPVDKVLFLAGEHGVALFNRLVDIQAKGQSIEQSLCIAELAALDPLRQLIKPALKLVA